jgi:hypothetical protein
MKTHKKGCYDGMTTVLFVFELMASHFRTGLSMTEWRNVVSTATDTKAFLEHEVPALYEYLKQMYTSFFALLADIQQRPLSNLYHLLRVVNSLDESWTDDDSIKIGKHNLFSRRLRSIVSIAKSPVRTTEERDVGKHVYECTMKQHLPDQRGIRCTFEWKLVGQLEAVQGLWAEVSTPDGLQKRELKHLNCPHVQTSPPATIISDHDLDYTPSLENVRLCFIRYCPHCQTPYTMIVKAPCFQPSFPKQREWIRTMLQKLSTNDDEHRAVCRPLYRLLSDSYAKCPS